MLKQLQSLNSFWSWELKSANALSYSRWAYKKKERWSFGLLVRIITCWNNLRECQSLVDADEGFRFTSLRARMLLRRNECHVNCCRVLFIKESCCYSQNKSFVSIYLYRWSIKSLFVAIYLKKWSTK